MVKIQHGVVVEPQHMATCVRALCTVPYRTVGRVHGPRDFTRNYVYAVH